MALKKGNTTASESTEPKPELTSQQGQPVDPEELRKQQEADAAAQEELRQKQAAKEESERKEREEAERKAREEAQERQREQDKRDAATEEERLRQVAEAKGQEADEQSKFIEVTNVSKVDWRQPSTGMWISSGETKDLRNDGWLRNQLAARLFTKAKG